MPLYWYEKSGLEAPGPLVSRERALAAAMILAHILNLSAQSWPPSAP